MTNNKEKNFISIVLYLYNDETCIQHCVTTLAQIMNEHFLNYEMILVNDGSTDATIPIVKEAMEQITSKEISIVNLSAHYGLENAMNIGTNLAIGDFVYELDSAQIPYDEEILLRLYESSLSGFDIVTASPHQKRGISSFFYKVFNSSSKITYKLQSELCRILSRRAINRIQSMSKTIPYRKALYSNCGLKKQNMEFSRIKLPSKGNFTEKSKTAMDSLVLFTDLAYKISIVFAGLMMLLTAAGVIYTIIIWLSGMSIKEGYTSIMLVITAAFFGVFSLFVAVLKYLSVITKLVFKNKEYLVESIEKISK